VLLGDARHEARHILKGDDRNVEGVAEADEAGGLLVQDAGTEFRVVGDDSDRRPADADESDEHVLCPVVVRLDHLAVVCDGGDDFLHVVGAGGLVGDDLVQLRAESVRAVRGRGLRQRTVATVRKVGEEHLDPADAVLIVFRCEVADAALAGMRHGAAQILMRDLFADHGLDDVGARDVHVACLLDHEDPVGESGRIDCAARRRPHDGDDLGDVAGGDRVAVEDTPIALQGENTFLDAGSAGIIDGNEGLAGLDRHVHHFPDLFSVHFSEASADAGKILGGRKNGSAVHLSETGYDAVGVDFLFSEPEQRRAVFHKKLGFLEGPLVEEKIQPFAGGQFPLFMLFGDRLRSSHGQQGIAFLLEGFDLPFRRCL